MSAYHWYFITSFMSICLWYYVCMADALRLYASYKISYCQSVIFYPFVYNKMPVRQCRHVHTAQMPCAYVTDIMTMWQRFRVGIIPYVPTSKGYHFHSSAKSRLYIKWYHIFLSVKQRLHVSYLMSKCRWDHVWKILISCFQYHVHWLAIACIYVSDNRSKLLVSCLCVSDFEFKSQSYRIYMPII